VLFFLLFSLIALMELGDKTQFAIIELSSEYEFPLLVYVGVMLAFALITGVAATLGSALTKFVPLKHFQLGSGLVFILLGIVLLISAILEFV